MIKRLLAVVSLLLAVAACGVGLEHGLDERQANEVVAALDRSGIVGDKVADDSQDKWKVMVARNDLGRAVAVLASQGLPRRAEQGTAETFAHPGLMPSAVADQARLQAAVASDLERTLATLPGVVSARVHVNLPIDDPLRGDGTHPRPTASVVLRVQRAAWPTPADVRRVVAPAVGGLHPADVEVLLVPSSPDNLAPAMLALGPFHVAAESRAFLAGVLGGGALLIMALSALVVVAYSRRRR